MCLETVAAIAMIGFSGAAVIATTAVEVTMGILKLTQQDMRLVTRTVTLDVPPALLASTAPLS